LSGFFVILYSYVQPRLLLWRMAAPSPGVLHADRNLCIDRLYSLAGSGYTNNNLQMT
jgi:hypothetical protein